MHEGPVHLWSQHHAAGRSLPGPLISLCHQNPVLWALSSIKLGLLFLIRAGNGKKNDNFVLPYLYPGKILPSQSIIKSGCKQLLFFQIEKKYFFKYLSQLQHVMVDWGSEGSLSAVSHQPQEMWGWSQIYTLNSMRPAFLTLRRTN